MRSDTPSTGLEAVTRSLLVAAMDIAARKHQVVAANVANASAPGYQPLRLDFEAHVAAAREAWRRDGRVAPEAAEQLAAAATQQQPEETGEFRVDEQLVEMARNSLHYQSVLQGMSRHLGLLALAVSEGRK